MKFLRRPAKGETISLNRSNDFRRMYSRAKNRVSPLFVVYWSKNGTDGNRVGFTVSRKIGCAVERNRARRVMHEAFRLLVPPARMGFDFIFVARGRTPSASSDQIRSEMNRILGGAGLLQKTGSGEKEEGKLK